MMKKTMAVLLTAMLLLGLFCPALAYDEEITWQGIPWGSSAAEVSQALADAGMIENLSVDLSDGYMPIGYQIAPVDFGIQSASNESLLSSKGESVFLKELGEYTVDSVEFDYIHEIKDGAVDWNTSCLVQITLTLKGENIDSLKAALDSIYGDAVEYTAYTASRNSWCWYGANDTAVGLTRWNGMFPVVIYGKTDTQELLAEQKTLLGGE